METYQKSLNRALDELMEARADVYLIGEDISDPYGGAFKVTSGLSRKYPGRVINTPISEAAITGIAAGMALRGVRPVVEIMFGDFITLATDQIVTNIAKFKWMYNDEVSVPLVIRTPMGGRRGYGPTHSQSLEKIFFGIPHLKVVAPSYLHSPGELLKASVSDDEPVLFIEYKLDYPRILKSKDEFAAEGWHLSKSEDKYPIVRLSPTAFQDDDVTIVTYGGMTNFAEEAARLLLEEWDIAVEVVIPSLISPLTDGALISILGDRQRIVVVEEGTLSNGWGAELVARLSEGRREGFALKIRRLAAEEHPVPNSKELEDAMLPGVDKIVRAVKGVM